MYILHHDYTTETFGHFERENQKQRPKETKQVWDDAKQRKVLQMNIMGLPTWALYLCIERAARDCPKRPKKKKKLQRGSNDYLKAP